MCPMRGSRGPRAGGTRDEEEKSSAILLLLTSITHQVIRHISTKLVDKRRVDNFLDYYFGPISGLDRTGPKVGPIQGIVTGLSESGQFGGSGKK